MFIVSRFRGYRNILDAHALNMLIKPIYKPRPRLAVFPQEPLYSIPQPFRFVPAHRYDIVYPDLKSDINKVYEQQPEHPQVEKPAKMHWFGYPV